MLADAGCDDLLVPKYVNIVDNPSNFQERKAYALCKCVEHHLAIDKDTMQAKREGNRRYEIAKYHWPVAVLHLPYQTTSLLNVNDVQQILQLQATKYGITSMSLKEDINTYDHYVSKLVKDKLLNDKKSLSAEEQLMLNFFVQAPITTKSDIQAYLQCVAPSRSANATNRVSFQLSASEDTQIVDESVSAGATLLTCNDLDSSPHDNVESTDSPLNSRNLFPTVLQDSPNFVQSEDDLIRHLSAKYERYQQTLRSADDFLSNNQVKEACRALSLLHKRETPILLDSKSSSTNGNYAPQSSWLFICKCGKPLIGSVNNGYRSCDACRKREARREKQIINAERLSDPSSTASFKTLITPVKAKLHQKMRAELVKSRKRTLLLSRALSAFKTKQTLFLSEHDHEGNKLLESVTDFFNKTQKRWLKLFTR